MLKLRDVHSFEDVFGGKLVANFNTLLQDVEYTVQKLSISMEEAYFSLDIAKYMDIDSTTIGLICVIQDITEQKKLENMQKEFVANVSHELRTPLTTIKSYAETLLEGAVDDLETTSRFLGVINNESDHMTALVQDLLELSKIDSNKVAIDQEVINLAKLLFHSVENYRIHANKKNQELTMEGVVGEYLVIGDVNRLEQVIKNLLSNAIKYSEDDASINVKLSSNTRYHKISVTDTGMGIPDEDLAHVFDRFYRVDKARSRAMGGTGLGLAIAKEIVELHSGFIQATSKLNQGTSFTIYLPVYQDEYNEDV
jgi:two-component system sensor histidine kinase VicK